MTRVLTGLASLGLCANRLNVPALALRQAPRDLSPQHCDQAVGEGQPLGHYGNEVGQQFLAEQRVFVFESLELVRA